MRKIDLVIFDLWNTLIPATIDFNKITSLLNNSKIDRKELIPRYEAAVQLREYNNFSDLRNDFFKEFNEVENRILEEELKEIFVKRYQHIEFFLDVIPTLKFLKTNNYKLALLSNTENFVAKHLEENLGAKNYFDFFAYSYKIGYIKPKKEAFLAVLEKFDVKAENTLMVGDSLRSDIKGAKDVKINTCLINRCGEIIDPAKIKPDFEIDTLEKLTAVLEELSG